MSIDTRLRNGLRDEVEILGAPVGDWDAVVARAGQTRSHRKVRRYTAVGLVAAAAVVVVALLLARPEAVSPDPAPPVPSPTPTTSSPGVLTSSLPFEGSWTSGPAPARLIQQELETAGLGEWFDEVIEGGSPGSERRSALRLSGGRLTMWLAVDEGILDVVDVQGYTADGNRIRLKPDGLGCATDLRWRVTNDVLRLQMLKDTCPRYRGTPDEAILRGLYTTYPFTRAD